MSASPKVAEFFAKRDCVIADSSSAFAAVIKECLQAIGISNQSLHVAKRFKDAEALILSKKPVLLVTEYKIEEQHGFDLVEKFRKQNLDKAHLSIVITKESADSVVAEAAEEQVDAFLVKPFSPSDFRTKLDEVIAALLNPSAYKVQIETGKAMLTKSNFAGAIKMFGEAKTLNEKPSLACYYKGRAHKEAKNTKAALGEYKEGLTYQPLHYFCLMGAFELLIDTRNFDEAHTHVRTILDNFPLTPYRMGQMFVASTLTKSFELMDRLLQFYAQLDNRPEKLNSIAQSTVFAAAKNAMDDNNMAEAAKYFEKGILISGRNMAVLERVISGFLLRGEIKPAQQFLAMIPRSEVGSPLYAQLQFKVDCKTMPKQKVIEIGRKLVADGHGDPFIFENLVRIMVEEGKVTLAESIIDKAVSSFPNLRASLYQIIEKGQKTG